MNVANKLFVTAVAARRVIDPAQVDLEFRVISRAVFLAFIDQHNESAFIHGQRCIVARQQSFQVSACLLYTSPSPRDS